LRHEIANLVREFEEMPRMIVVAVLARRAACQAIDAPIRGRQQQLQKTPGTDSRRQWSDR